MTEKRKMLIRGTLAVLIGCAASFLITHIYYLADSTVMMYISLYTEKIWEFLFPLLSVRFILSALRYGKKNATLAAVLSVFARVIFLFPFFYEYYVLDGGYTSGDALLLASLRSSVAFITSSLHISLLLLLSLIVFRAIAVRRGENTVCADVMMIGERPKSLYDFSHAPTLMSALLALAELVYTLIREIIDTANFLSSHITTLEPVELISIIFGYVLAIALFFVGHFLTLRIGEYFEKQ